MSRRSGGSILEQKIKRLFRVIICVTNFVYQKIRSSYRMMTTGCTIVKAPSLDPRLNGRKFYIGDINNDIYLNIESIEAMPNNDRILEGNLGERHCICSVQEVIASAVKINQAKLDARQSKIKVKIEPKLPKLICEPIRICQAICNLLSNAIKYSFNNSIINVVAKIVDEDLHIEVIDQGVGMTKEELALATKEYLNFDEPLGLGVPIGLLITQGLLNAQDAKLVIDSKVNVGTTMRVIFPKYKLVYGQKVKVNKESEA